MTFKKTSIYVAVALAVCSANSSANTYVVQLPNQSLQATQAPAITSLSPATGDVGSTFTVSGSGFTATGMKLLVGGAVTAFTFIDSSSLLVTVPNVAPGATAVKVERDYAIFSNTMTYTVAAPATLASINPTSGLSADTVVLSGTNFEASGMSVYFEGIPVSFVYNSAAQLTVTVPNVALGSYTVTVVKNGNQTAGISYSVVNPTLTSMIAMINGTKSFLSAGGILYTKHPFSAVHPQCYHYDVTSPVLTTYVAGLTPVVGALTTLCPSAGMWGPMTNYIYQSSSSAYVPSTLNATNQYYRALGRSPATTSATSNITSAPFVKSADFGKIMNVAVTSTQCQQVNRTLWFTPSPTPTTTGSNDSLTYQLSSANPGVCYSDTQSPTGYIFVYGLN